MPIKDDDERRTYFREYMRKRRAAERSGKTAGDPPADMSRAAPEPRDDPSEWGKIYALKREVMKLEADHLSEIASDIAGYDWEMVVDEDDGSCLEAYKGDSMTLVVNQNGSSFLWRVLKITDHEEIEVARGKASFLIAAMATAEAAWAAVGGGSSS